MEFGSIGYTGINMRVFRKFKRVVVVLCLTVVGYGVMFSGPALAQYNSTNYSADEVFIGSGGTNDASSTNYQGRASIGDMVVGNSTSTSYQAYGGFTTASDPVLEMNMDPVNTDLGAGSSAATSTLTATFSVRAYLSSGYSVYAIGAPPTSSAGRQIAPLTSGGSSTTGVSQFGMNLVANTTPSIGANPSQIPDSSFSFGAAASGYGTANSFKYNNGDKIAQSTTSSGHTLYTMSYIFNFSPIEYAGVYVLNQSIVVVPVY